jgi:signal peptidase I
MLPTIWPGDKLVIEPVSGNDVSEGDIVLFDRNRRFVAHRVVTASHSTGESWIQTQGDAATRPDLPVGGSDLLGKVSFILRNGRCIEPSRSLRLSERAVAALVRRSEIAARVVVGVHGLCQASLGLTS